jgi:hypothetical protein
VTENVSRGQARFAKSFKSLFLNSWPDSFISSAFVFAAFFEVAVLFANF